MRLSLIYAAWALAFACSVYDPSLITKSPPAGGTGGQAGASKGGSAGTTTATGGVGGTTGGSSSAGATVGGAGGSSEPSNFEEELIDNMEDGNYTFVSAKYLGNWYSFADTTPGGCRAPHDPPEPFVMTPLSGQGGAFGRCETTTPLGTGGAGGAAPMDEAGGASFLTPPGMGGSPGSTFAVYLRGIGFTVWGSGLGMNIGDNLAVDDGWADFSGWDGISFWARRSDDGVENIIVYVRERRSLDPTLCTKCVDFVSGFTLTTEWTKVRLPFDKFKQGAGGEPHYEGVDPSGVKLVQFVTGAGSKPLDLWLDDISLYRAVP